MKNTNLAIAFSLIITALITGCDVTDDDGTGNSSASGDPVVVDFPIAYIERPLPFGLEDEDDDVAGILADNILDPTQFRPGAKLIIKDRASVSAPTRVITERLFPPLEDPETLELTPQLYDVRDIAVNADATLILMAVRAPEIEGADEDEQPTWNIWEYDLANDTLNRLIFSDLIAEAGQDRFPTYLPNDDVVFSSTRQRTSKSLLLDQSRPQYSYVTEADDDSRAFTLHTWERETEAIEQISYGKGHDIQPTVLDDGRILFLRGDDTSNANGDRLSLYTMNADGSNLSPHYGFHSPSGGDTENQGILAKPVELQDGRILVTYKTRESFILGGDIYGVNTRDYIDLTTPTAVNLGATGPAEQALSSGEVLLDAQSPHGYFNSAYPLFDNTNRLLVSWMPCLVQGFRINEIYVRTVNTDVLDDDDVLIEVLTTYQLINRDGALVDRNGNLIPEGGAAVEVDFDEVISLPCTADTFGNENIQPADPQYTIWIYDPANQTQNPVTIEDDPSIMHTEAIVIQPRTAPDFFIPPAPFGLTTDQLQALRDENAAILNIRSIYDFDGQDVTPDGIAALADPLRTPTDSRTVRFVRFLEHANMPHEDDYEIDEDLVRGRNNQPGKSLLGYAQVHPDGSIMTKVPANTAFTMEFVDANGRRVNGTFGTRHRNWLNLRPGEVRTCNGCHTPNSTEPHGRLDAEPEPANAGALAEAPFTNTALRDRNGIPYPPPNVGETMAEYYIRIKLADPGETEASDLLKPLTPSVDIVYTDEWTDAGSGATPGADIRFEYGVLESAGPDNLSTTAPVLIGNCLVNWNHLCRIVIDYPTHIQPLFEITRTMMIDGVMTEGTCLDCHSPVDIDGNAQVPAPDAGNLQLDFTNIVSPLDDDGVFLKGYDELFANGDPLQMLDPATGQLVPQLIPLVINGEVQYQMVQQTDMDGTPLFEATDLLGMTVCVPLATTDPDVTLVLDGNGANVPCLELVYEVDEDGEFVLDSAGQRIPIPILVANTQGRYLSGNGANAGQNQRFFNAFSTGGPHAGYLNAAELKLISEWLDTGGQYYNEIFKALED